MKFNMKRKQAGATILEAIAYLGIAAVVIIGALSLFGSGLSGADTNKAMEELTGIRSGTKSFFTGQAGYGTSGTLLNGALITAKVIPGTMSVSGTNITNAWGGAVNVTSTGTAFTIQTDLVPQDVCAKITSAAGGSGWMGISVNGAAMTMPTTSTSAAAACNAATNTIIFTAS